MAIRTHTASLTRPANTTQYAVGDVITGTTAAALPFNLGTSQGRIRSAMLIDGAYQTTKPDIDLILFDSLITLAADNAAFAPTDAEMATAIGVISFFGANMRGGDLTAGAGGNGIVPVDGLDILLSGEGSIIYGVLVARNTYTPVSAETFTVRLGVES